MSKHTHITPKVTFQRELKALLKTISKGECLSA